MYIFNDPYVRMVEVASGSGIGTAEALAKVYGIIANGGQTVDGTQLLSQELIKKIDKSGSPLIKDETIGIPTKFSSGFFRITYEVDIIWQ